jgi:hypothetical protein
MWVSRLTNGEAHALPINDLKPHAESPACKCEPRVEEVSGGKVVVHNSFDGREFFEDDAAFDGESWDASRL